MQALIQGLVDRSPYNIWLGLRVIRADAEGVEVEAAWRDEFISAPERRAVHGGVLAALVDSGAVFAVVARTGMWFMVCTGYVSINNSRQIQDLPRTSWLCTSLVLRLISCGPSMWRWPALIPGSIRPPRLTRGSPGIAGLMVRRRAKMCPRQRAGYVAEGPDRGSSDRAVGANSASTRHRTSWQAEPRLSPMLHRG
jgi:hypothetical protein